MFGVKNDAWMALGFVQNEGDNMIYILHIYHYFIPSKSKNHKKHHPHTIVVCMWYGARTATFSTGA